MRLIFITQKIDKNDNVLGTYHQWVEKLSERIEKINVICLYRGQVELPANVKVYSLGKESGESKIKYLLNFFRYTWRLRNDYDSIFVHMNPEYIILGGFFWKLLGKKIIFWYNHPFGNWRARLAVALAEVVLYTSPFAFVARYKKAKQMPVGIDTNLFSPIAGIKRKKNSILYLGRISPIKKLEVLLDAAEILFKKNINFFLDIVGTPSKTSEEAYAKAIKNKAQPLIKLGKIRFLEAVPNYKAPTLYSAYELSVNMTPTGSFDKAIIESMACETPALVSNRSLSGVLSKELIFEENNADSLAEKISEFLKLPTIEKEAMNKKLRQFVVESHDLKKLVEKIAKLLTNGR